MLETFINRHRKATILVSGLLIILFIVWVIYSISSSLQSPVNTTGLSLPNNGIDGLNESEYHGETNFLYTISAPKNKTITISAVEGYRSPAISELYSDDLNPTDYKITFTNYENPFTPYE